MNTKTEKPIESFLHKNQKNDLKNSQSRKTKNLNAPL